MARRNLSGIYFRERIDGKWENVCFEELSESTQDEVLLGKDEEYLRNLCKMLAHTINEIGEVTGIAKE